jgi:hypothetical protein
MGRDWWGYDPTVPVDDLFARNRGRWKLGPRADHETHAIFSYTGDHEVKFVVEIHGIEKIGDRRAIVGRVLDSTDPLSLMWVGAEAPGNYRNPVHYIADSNEQKCACGCRKPVPEGRLFVPGHDQRAVHDRISREWGSTIQFIRWFDRTYPDLAPGD